MRLSTQAIAVAVLLVPPLAAADEPVDYLRQIKPMLAARCYPCHSALRQQSNFRLDTAQLLVAGGDWGPAVVPGNSAESLIVQMVTGESGVRMPPEKDGAALSDAQIALLKRWVDEGARAPKETPPPDPRDHWAFRPPLRPNAPEEKDASWVRNPVDAFLAAEHAMRGLVPVAEAEKPVLLRRVYLDLIGLPPKRDELLAFLSDDEPDAYERVVDRLLASPQYGERWARHWMDVWRYSDWYGYKMEVRNSVRHIWRWRDWIVESLNADKGYDHMVMEMVAGDELAPGDARVLPATGFLARNRYAFNRSTWLEATVDHTVKAFLGLTMNCCRCHDHKYDPISQLEYYQLRAIFEPHDVRTDRVPGQPDTLKDGLAHAVDAHPDALTYVFERGDEAQPDKEHPVPPAVPAVLGGELAFEPIELPLAAYYPALRPVVIAEDSRRAAKRVATAQAALAKARRQVATARTDGTPLDAAVAAAELAARQLATARTAQSALAARIDADKAKYGVSQKADAKRLAAAAAQTERELALCQAQQEQLAAEQALVAARASASANDAAALAAAEKKLATANTAIAAAHAALAEPGTEYTPLGDKSPRTSTGRRLAFARWLVDRANPLTARVAVNHIWLRHFGEPLVDDVADFGLRSPAARNQELLDWLAVEFMENGWQMKHIHRLLVTSTAYRMRSTSAGAAIANIELDPDNHSFWRMNARRLEAEAIRDSLFHVAGALDLARGGPELAREVALTTPRRSLYFRHAYEKEVQFLQILDGPSTNECYRRSVSVVPQQALTLANSQLSLEQSRRVARELTLLADEGADSDEAFVRSAYEQILSRRPSDAELAECGEFLQSQAELLSQPNRLAPAVGGPKVTVPPATDPRQRARENLTLVLYNHNDFITIR